MDCTNKKCPAYAKCLAPYRGSMCKATRATYGLGDPIINADRIRSMSDEELAEFMCHNVSNGTVNCAFCGAKEFCRMGHNGWLDWLKREADNE